MNQSDWPQLIDAWHGRVLSLSRHVDPSWWPPQAHELSALSSTLKATPGSELSVPLQQFLLSLCKQYCGPTPDLNALDCGIGRWALLTPKYLHVRLGALALWLRPGVLRSCVLRSQRMALEAMLGEMFEIMRQHHDRCAPVLPMTHTLEAQQWAYIGYADLVKHHKWPHRTLRRWVRLSMHRQIQREVLLPRILAQRHDIDNGVQFLNHQFSNIPPPPDDTSFTDLPLSSTHFTDIAYGDMALDTGSLDRR